MACRTHVSSGLDAWLSLTLDSDLQLCGLVGLSGFLCMESGSGLDAERFETTEELRLTPQIHLRPEAGRERPNNFNNVCSACFLLGLFVIGS